MKGIQTASIVITATLVVAACSSSSTSDSTTTSAITPLTTSAALTTETTQVPETTTTRVLSTLTPPEYHIVDRAETEAPGDTVVVLLDDETYTSLTDIDLYDIIAEVVDLFPPISTIHIVDDDAAVNTVANPDATDEDIALIERNYLAVLENGFNITYLGPFADSGTAILGS